MTKSKAVLIAGIGFAVGAALSYVAIQIDASGAAANLVVDILIAAIITVSLRTYYVRRSQRDYSRQFDSARRKACDLLDGIEAFDKQWIRWAEQGIDAARGDDWFDWLIGRHPSWDSRWNDLRPTLQYLTTEYGTVDFLIIGDRMWRMREEANLHQATFAKKVRELDRLRPSPLGFDISLDGSPAMPENEKAARRDELAAEANQALKEVADLIDKMSSDNRLLKNTLLKGYPLQKVGPRHIPDPFPSWVRYVAWIAGLMCLGLWIAAYFLDERFPRGFAKSIMSNALSAGIALAVGTGFAVIASFSISRHVLIAASLPISRLSKANLALAGLFQLREVAMREKALSEISSTIRDSVNQLQHITADARLDRYADLLITGIEAAKGQPVQGSSNSASPPPSDPLIVPDLRPPRTVYLFELGSQLTDRAYDLYQRGRSL